MKAFKKTALKKQRVSNRPTPEGLRAEKALQLAVDGVIEEHRRLGLPIAVMRNGKAVYVNVDEKVPVVREKTPVPRLQAEAQALGVPISKKEIGKAHYRSKK